MILSLTWSLDSPLCSAASKGLFHVRKNSTLELLSQLQDSSGFWCLPSLESKLNVFLLWVMILVWSLIGNDLRRASFSFRSCSWEMCPIREREELWLRKWAVSCSKWPVIDDWPGLRFWWRSISKVFVTCQNDKWGSLFSTIRGLWEKIGGMS